GPSVRFVVQPEPGSLLGPIAVSPNGRWLAFVAFSKGRGEIWLRDMTRPVATPIPGTESNSATLFWSADSHWIAFFARSKLRRVAPTGGVVETLCCDNNELDTLFNQRAMLGGTWSRNGDILLGGRARGIIRIASNATHGTVIVKPPPGGELIQPEFL